MSTTKVKTYPQAPYYDDFNEDKGFYRILYRPGFAVQARELTQMQTSIQAQIDRAGQYAFKDGSRVVKGQVTLNTEFDYIQIEDGFTQSTLGSATLTTSAYLSEFVGTTITGSSQTGNQVKAKVLRAEAADATSGAPITLYVKYKSKGGSNKTVEKFVVQEEFQSNATTVRFGKLLATGATVNGVATDAIGKGSIASISEGVYFISGSYVYVGTSDVILDKYSNTPSYLVGLTVTEEVVSSSEDVSLADNAAGTTNASAPGANRYKISAVLSKDALEKENRTINNFINLLRVRKGVTRVDKTDQADTGAELSKRLARRTFEESGNYSLNPYQLDIKAHDSDTDKFKVGIEPNVSYVQGFRNENLTTTFVDVDKPRDGTTDVGYENATVTQLTNGNFIKLTSSSVKGLPPIDDLTVINLRNSSNANIGTARVRDIAHNAAYIGLYVFDVTMTGSNNFSDVTNVIFSDPSAGVNDFVGTLATTGRRFKAGKQGGIWKLPYDAIKDTYQDGGTTVDVTYQVRKRFEDVTVSNSQLTIAAGTGEAFVNTATDVLIAPGNGAIISGTNVTFDSTSSSSLVIDADGLSISNGTVCHVIATVQKTAVQKNKTAQNNQTVTINVTDGDAASYSLAKADVFNIDSIVDVNGTNVTDRFVLDTGQTESFYGVSKIRKKAGAAPVATGNMVVTFDYYSHGAGDYFSVLSYGTSTSEYEGIGTFNSVRFGEVQLRDCIDFRPRKDDAGTNFTGTGSQLGLPPKVDSSVTADLHYYLPRADKLIQTINGNFEVIQGVASESPELPEDPENSIIIASMFLPPYVFDVSKISTKLSDNKRYTMRDIGSIDRRVKNLEYYTSLSLLEKSANDTQIFDGNDERFKNGILVDGFYGHNIGDVQNPDYNVSVDRHNGILRPKCSTKNVPLVRVAGENNTQTNKCDKNGSIVTMDKVSDVEFASQPYATNHINVNPYDVFTWGGIINLSPESDEWKEVDVRPDIIIDDTDAYDQFVKMAEEQNILGTVWNEWETNWTGTSIDSWSQQGTRQWWTGQNNWWNTGQTVTTTSTQTRTGLNTSVASDTVQREVGNAVVEVNFIPFMRSRKISFDAQLMKPNTKVYAFFNGVDVSDYVREESSFIEYSDIADGTDAVRTFEGSTAHPDGAGALETDSAGRVIGSFLIPRNDALKFKTGTREFRLTDDPSNNKDNEGTFAEAQFHAQGLLEVQQKTIISTKVPRLVTTELQDNRTITQTQVFEPIRWSDPLAQTILVDEKGGIYLTSVDLYFKTKDANIPVEVSIRSVENGIPTQKVVPGADVVKYPTESLVYAGTGNSTPTAGGDVATSGIATDETARYGTRFTFDHPIYLPQDGEFAIVVMAQTNNYNAFISTMGGFDLQNANERVSKQPYNGVLFTSQNASTWTPEQNSDLKFALNRASFRTNADSEINLVNRALPSRLLPNQPFRTINTVSNGNAYVRVTHPNHGFHTSGSKVRFKNTTAVNGITTAQLEASAGYVVSEVEHDSYTIVIPSATVTSVGSGGGSTSRVFDNVHMDVANLIMQTIQLPDTELKLYMRTYNSQGVNDTAGGGALQNEVRILANTNLNFESPQAIYNELNEAVFGDNNATIGNKSFQIRAVMSTTLENISPVIDMNRCSVIGIQNVVNNAEENQSSYDESNSDARAYTAETSPTGGSEIAKYITKEVELNDEATVLRVLLNVNRPTGTNVDVYYKVLGAGSDDQMNEINWVEATPDDPIEINNSGQHSEVEYNVTPGDNFGSMMFKIVLRASNSSKVPTLRDFRVIAAT